jgi:enolase
MKAAFAPNLSSATEALDVILQAIEAAGYKPGKDVMLALDCASTEFFKNGRYAMEGEGKTLSPSDMAKFLADLAGAILSSRSRMGWPRMTGMAGRR